MSNDEVVTKVFRRGSATAGGSGGGGEELPPPPEKSLQCLALIEDEDNNDVSFFHQKIGDELVAGVAASSSPQARITPMEENSRQLSALKERY
ncbi:hypothetical protein C0Q70_10761 [Pomacea canaliculata]|uniref:Uncharacterized protein n=1 Tax=Pomacea canaliculata TaxID=400727 RepID=A0A2T7P421_POMCA|nr:hypothetical protein C0Q70_10761 [Pomacea canaliculata]